MRSDLAVRLTAGDGDRRAHSRAAIPGVSTTGVKLTVADPEEDPDYLYTAALNDRTSIVVMGSADQQLDPQRLMSDLLVKAVAAVRGQ